MFRIFRSRLLVRFIAFKRIYGTDGELGKTYPGEKHWHLPIVGFGSGMSLGGFLITSSCSGGLSMTLYIGEARHASLYLSKKEKGARYPIPFWLINPGRRHRGGVRKGGQIVE